MLGRGKAHKKPRERRSSSRAEEGAEHEERGGIRRSRTAHDSHPPSTHRARRQQAEGSEEQEEPEEEEEEEEPARQGDQQQQEEEDSNSVWHYFSMSSRAEENQSNIAWGKWNWKKTSLSQTSAQGERGAAGPQQQQHQQHSARRSTMRTTTEVKQQLQQQVRELKRQLMEEQMEVRQWQARVGQQQRQPQFSAASTPATSFSSFSSSASSSSPSFSNVEEGRLRGRRRPRATEEVASEEEADVAPTDNEQTQLRRHISYGEQPTKILPSIHELFASPSPSPSPFPHSLSPSPSPSPSPLSSFLSAPLSLQQLPLPSAIFIGEQHQERASNERVELVQEEEKEEEEEAQEEQEQEEEEEEQIRSSAASLLRLAEVADRSRSMNRSPSPSTPSLPPLSSLFAESLQSKPVTEPVLHSSLPFSSTTMSLSSSSRRPTTKNVTRHPYPEQRHHQRERGRATRAGTKDEIWTSDASLSLFSMMKDLLNSYATHCYYCLPVPFAVFDEGNLRYLLYTREGREEITPLSLNLCVVLMNAAQIVGNESLRLEYYNKARLQLTELFDRTDMSIVEALLGLTHHALSTMQYEQMAYLSLLALQISKRAEKRTKREKHVYLRTLYVFSIMPGVTDDRSKRTQVFRELKRTKNELCLMASNEQERIQEQEKEQLGKEELLYHPGEATLSSVIDSLPFPGLYSVWDLFWLIDEVFEGCSIYLVVQEKVDAYVRRKARESKRIAQSKIGNSAAQHKQQREEKEERRAITKTNEYLKEKRRERRERKRRKKERHREQKQGQERQEEGRGREKRGPKGRAARRSSLQRERPKKTRTAEEDTQEERGQGKHETEWPREERIGGSARHEESTTESETEEEESHPVHFGDNLKVDETTINMFERWLSSYKEVILAYLEKMETVVATSTNFKTWSDVSFTSSTPLSSTSTTTTTSGNDHRLPSFSSSFSSLGTGNESFSSLSSVALQAESRQSSHLGEPSSRREGDESTASETSEFKGFPSLSTFFTSSFPSSSHLFSSFSSTTAHLSRTSPITSTTKRQDNKGLLGQDSALPLPALTTLRLIPLGLKAACYWCIGIKTEALRCAILFCNETTRPGFADNYSFWASAVLGIIANILWRMKEHEMLREFLNKILPFTSKYPTAHLIYLRFYNKLQALEQRSRERRHLRRKREEERRKREETEDEEPPSIIVGRW
ncbi:Protein kinase domain-containing protein [Balamuthia mandrillaris]